MSTHAHHDPTSIALDARRVHDQAVTDLKDKSFHARVDKAELAKLLDDIEALEAHGGDRSARLADKIAAGVHAASARAAVLAVVADIREDVRLAFPGNAALQHAFGVGQVPVPASTAQVLQLGHAILAGAEAHPAEAGQVGLDHHGIAVLEDALHALEGADLAHVHAAGNRHTTSTETDSLAHVVATEVARIRRVAHRLWKDDPDHLAGYRRTLPRHQVKPRTPAPAPTA